MVQSKKISISLNLKQKSNTGVGFKYDKSIGQFRVSNERKLFDNLCNKYFPKHLHLEISFYAIFDKWHKDNPKDRKHSFKVGYDIMVSLVNFNDIGQKVNPAVKGQVLCSISNDINFYSSAINDGADFFQSIYDETVATLDSTGDAMAEIAKFSWETMNGSWNWSCGLLENGATYTFNAGYAFLSYCIKMIEKSVPNIKLQQQYTKIFQEMVIAWSKTTSNISLAGLTTFCGDILTILLKQTANYQFSTYDQFVKSSTTIAGLKLNWTIDKKFLMKKVIGNVEVYDLIPVFSFSISILDAVEIVINPFIGLFKYIKGSNDAHYISEICPFVAFPLGAVSRTAGNMKIESAKYGDIISSGIGYAKNEVLVCLDELLKGNGINKFTAKALPLRGEEDHKSGILSFISGVISPEIGGFPGPGWGGKAKTRPKDMFDLAGKIHDFGYHVNEITFLGETVVPDFNLFLTDKYTLSRKAKCDYIFRKMTNQISKNFAQSLATWVANYLFSGSSPSEFNKNDGFANILSEHNIDPKDKGNLQKPDDYLMIPYEKLPSTDKKKLNSDKNTKCSFDTNPGWLKWGSPNIPYWNEIYNLK